MVDRELKNKLRQAAITDFSAQIERMRQALTGKHTSGNMTMDVLVTGQQPDQAHSTPQALIAIILLQGTASANGQVVVGDHVAKAPLKQEAR